MQVSGRITEIVLRTDDKETGVKISFSLDSEQELDLARMRGQALVFTIEPRQTLKQGSLFDATQADKILQVDFGSGPQHPWEPKYIEVEGEDGEHTDKLVCGYDGCTQPEEKHKPMRDKHFYRPLGPEQLKDLAEVPDYCADCTLPARFHYQRPDHTYQETNEPGPSGEMISHCAVEGCEVPAALHMRNLDAPAEADDGEHSEEWQSVNYIDPDREPSAVEPESAVDEQEVISVERDVTDVPVADLSAYPHSEDDRATEETFRARRGGRQRGRGTEESEPTSAEPEAERAEPGDPEA